MKNYTVQRSTEKKLVAHKTSIYLAAIIAGSLSMAACVQKPTLENLDLPPAN